MEVLRLKRCSIAFHFKTGSGVASSLRAFNEALTLLSNYHKGTLVIVQCGTRRTVLFAAVRQNELTFFFVPLSFLILLPLIHSFFFFFFFITSVFLFSISSLHFSLITVQFTPPSPRLFPSILQTAARLPNLSAFMCFTDKALSKGGKYGTGNWNVQEVSYLTWLNTEIRRPQLQVHTLTAV